MTNSALSNTPLSNLQRDTVELPSRRAISPAKICCPKREIIGDSGSALGQQTQALLRSRLRASAFVLLVGFGVFLVRHIVGVLMGEPLYPVLLGFHVLVVVVLAVGAMPLCRQCPISMRKLRVAELVTFGLPGLFFLALQHRVILSDVWRGVVPPPMSFWLLLIFTYAMFIPNTWRRAAPVVGAMAIAPVLLIVAMALLDPAVAQTISADDYMQHILVMAVAAVAAVFGIHLINALRREAFEAKQLGQYRLVRRLGEGAMGEVYLAEHRMLKRPCAVKLIRPSLAGDPHVLSRFEREVQMTARLSHWNTVEIYDYGRTEDGIFFYVMEHLSGLSLEELLRRHGPLPAERVVHLVRQVCQALREAHGIGLIHRDIKPGNIFVAEIGGVYDVAKVLDFGLVKPMAETPAAHLTQEGTISGTPLFMSPEQARGLSDVDARSDIYSLGAVAYTLLAGRPPFDMPSPLDVIIAQARDEVAPVSRFRSDVPADVEQVILRCLAKSPADRFQDADGLERALADCSVADQWTRACARRWWQEHEPSAAAPIQLRDAGPVSLEAVGQL